MTLTLSTIRDNIYDDLYSHIQTGTYAISTDNIHPSANDKQLRDEGFPQVIISDIITSDNKITKGRISLYEINYSIMFHIYHNSAENARTLTDEIQGKFRGNGRAYLRTLGFKRLKWETDDYEMIHYGPNKTAHIYHLNLTGVFVAKT